MKKFDVAPLTRGLLFVQVRVSGMQFGAWGMRHYGPRPIKQDALRFYTEHLQALLPDIQASQRERETQQSVVPTAFVTFRTRKSQVC